MATISPIHLNDRLAKEPQLFVIDVRTPAEFEEVHVPQAKNIPLDELAPQTLLQEVGADRPVFVLCHAGNRAARAADRLRQAGCTEPIVVTGGTSAWDAAGLPVVRGRKTISLERQVRIVAGALVFTGVVLGVFVHPAFLGLSAFVGAGLVFAGITDFCGMGLLLARMPWNKRAA